MRRITCLAFMAMASSAQAHLMPAQQATLNVVDDAVFAVVSVPVSALHGFDDDGDGLLEMGELQRHQDALRREIDRRFTISDGSVAAESVRVDLVLSPEHEAATDRAAHVVALKHVRFHQPVQDLRVRSDLFGSEPQLTVTATCPADKSAETAILTPAVSEHRFFRSRMAVLLGEMGALPLLLLCATLGVIARMQYTAFSARRPAPESTA